MNEQNKNTPETESNYELSVAQYLALAEKLLPREEPLPFPGVDEASLAKLRAEEIDYPGFATPVDELISKMANGIKLSLGVHPEIGNVYILPFSSDDIENDSLSPRHLNITPDMDKNLVLLILANRAAQTKYNNTL